MEEGKAKTVTYMYPTKSKPRKTWKDDVHKTLPLEDDDESGMDEAIGGYDPAIKHVLAKAEKRGNKSEKRIKSCRVSTDENSESDTDENPDSNSSSSEEKPPSLRDLERSIEQCRSDMSMTGNPGSSRDAQKTVEEPREAVQIIEEDNTP